MSNSRGAAKTLRTFLAGDEIVVAPGCFNAKGARMIERTGFSAVYVSGYGISVVTLAGPTWA